MTEQDTFDKLKHNLHAGMKLIHKFRKQMVGEEFNWYCTIDKVDAENNNLVVTITRAIGYSHTEDWDMATTLGGLATGEYIEINGETK